MMNFLPSFNVSSKCRRNCFIAWSLQANAMSKRKAVSADEKRARLLQLFYDKKEFFQLKDLEKIAPKEKGITANTVKETLQNLVDDGLVDTDKICSSAYFWAFPSKATNTLKRKLLDLTNSYEHATKKLKLTERDVENFGTDDDERERNALTDDINDLQIERDELLRQLKQFERDDPVVFEDKKRQIQGLRDAANRWTDNIFCVKTWCKNKFGIEDKVFNKQFQISENLDYLD